jgi:membrane protein
MDASAAFHDATSRRIAGLVRLMAIRFFAQGMTVYAAALAYRGILALVPFALLFLALIGLLGIEGSLPRLTALLVRLRGPRGEGGAAAGVPLEGLISLGAIVGVWSMATGARLFIRALNAAHAVDETRTPLARGVLSAVFLPALAALTVAATVLLLATSQLLSWAASWVGMAPIIAVLGSWLRMPLAMLVIAGTVAAAYRYAPSEKPPLRAVAAGAGVAVVLWTLASSAFAFVLSTFLDYGSTYGGLGAAVALLVYLHISAVVLLVGAQVSAVLGGRVADTRTPIARQPESRGP